MIFGWLRPEEEPNAAHLVEISTDKGDHIVVDAKNKQEAEAIEDIALDAGAEFDRDEEASYGATTRAAMRYNLRDHETIRVRSERVADPDEDLEPEEDDDRVREPDEVPADVEDQTKPWWRNW